MIRNSLITFLLLGAILVQAQSPIADGKEKFLGSVHSSSQIKDFEKYWNQVTPENAGKWGSVEGTRDSYNWTQLDAAYNFAKDNAYIFRFHVLLWGNQQPTWIESLSDEEQLEEIIEWMDAVAERYPDIDYLEVINEPLNDPPNGAGNGNYFKALGGTGTSGFEWILTAYRLANERFPNAKLVINEYNILNNPNRATTYVKIVNLLKEEELIDVVGVQGHAFTTTTTNETMEGVLDKLAETELPIMVTELDIDGPTDNDQLQDYKRIFPLLWEHPSVIGITLWGFRPGLWRNPQKAYLIDIDGSERPALGWLREYVEETDTSPKPLRENLLNELTIYPNPAKGEMNVSFHEAIRSVKAIDMTGKVAFESFVLSDSKINLPEGMSAGTYIFQISTISGNQFTRRIKVL
ncbi:MAG: endo-1,4-beta-xylanase [Marinoscillum sp.]